jgi:hypothetical protein
MMVAGTLLASTVVDALKDWTIGASHFARGHHVLSLLIVGAVVATFGGVRRLASARA